MYPSLKDARIWRRLVVTDRSCRPWGHFVVVDRRRREVDCHHLSFRRWMWSCRPKKKHPQVYVYHIFLSKKWKNAPKTLFQHEFVHVGCPPNGKWKFPFKDFFATAKSATRTCKLIGTLGVYVLLVARPTAKGWGYRRHQSEAKEPDQRLKPSRGIFRPIS